ncbi:hypothetical protein VTN02DRAFT_1321 [Thermoascus thermophilus]
MSDDEDFYDDEFDEDYVWFEDASPDAADDLAGTAINSPILIDDPSLDVEESFSDWDYYSDDYYDDDPSMIRRDARTRLPREKSSLTAHGTKTPARKKRRLAPTAEIPELSLGAAAVGDLESMRLDPTSFRSVVWRRPSHESITPELHEPGDGEKVALLKNWREIFKTSQPGKNDSGLVRVTTKKHLQSNSKSGRTTNRSSARGRAAAAKNRTKREPSLKVAVVVTEHPPPSYNNDHEDPGQQPESTTGEPLPPPPESIAGSEPPAAGLKKKKKRTSASENGSRLKDVISARDGMQDNKVSSVSDSEPKIAVEVPVPIVKPDGLDESLSVGTPPAPPPRRSQRNKRKADDSLDEESHDHTASTEEKNTRPRKKRMVSLEKQAPTTSLRRSTRTRKGQK